MTPFGNHWSDDSQMVLVGRTGKGRPPVLEVPVEKAGVYALVLHVSKAEDYGIFSFRLDDGPDTVAIDFFHPRLLPPTPVELKPATLTRGNHRLKILYHGKNPNSRNSLIGIDYLLLKDVPIRGPKPE